MHTSGSRIVRVGTSLAVPVRRRALVQGLAVVAALVAVGIATLTLGGLGIAPERLPAALIDIPGGSEGFVLKRLRGPRFVVAVATGAALGISGALFQTVTRNPLGSPDVIGLTAGAGAGAAAASLLLPGAVSVPAGAMLGAAGATVVVFVSTGRGFSSPSRLIIAGIGVSAMAVAFTQYVVMLQSRDQAAVLHAYLTGSLSARSWQNAAVIGGALAVLLPAAIALGRRLHLIEMGDELADALGGKAEQTRVWSIVVAIALSAAAVSVAGPIAFVSLTAPQITKRLSRTPGANVVLSALTGAFILAAADLCAQQVPVVEDLPVGVLTAGIGGLYLGYLLVREWKKGTV
ncbi:iron complex transport system permease protein [Halopolyspora algeriensis]|uniref:Iron complex transport system permease protein n=1 Tax=Halopolyspora algeriensis TaxID=1500506 RepID=A0A368VJX6_9ACTN|nr:iron chelate uptake ABC transporter family permease subunit [Halopolyspora algeriensis]RCW39958.1 iron complex transport system permease protein [Halopolyspora algeriensis]TQM46605.1 iron complex transport system permease protein [Halopolyspora algeriensis]